MSRSHPSLKTPHVWAILALGAIVLSLYSTGIFQQEIFNAGGFPQFWEFFRASIHPDLSAEFLRLTGHAALITLAFAVCGTFLSVVFGLLGAILISEAVWLTIFPRQTQFFWVRSVLRSALAVPRSIHEMIWGLLFVNLFGLDPLVGIVAIVVPYSAIVAKVFSELLDETPRQSLNALVGSGTPPLTALLYSLLPQAFLDLLSYSFYRFECSLRSAAVLGIIGAGGLGYQIMLSLQSLRYEQLWTLFYALVTLNGCVDLLSASIRHRLGSPSRLDLNFRKRSTHLNRHLSRPISPSSNAFLQFCWEHILRFAGLGAIVLIPFCFWVVGADYSKLWSPRTVMLFREIAQSTFPFNFQLSQLSQLLILSFETVAMSILAIVLAGCGGMLLSFPAAHNFFLPGGLLKPGQLGWGDRFLSWTLLLLTRLVLLVSRAIPAPIWALVALFIFFPGILPGAIALGLHNLGILGRLMAEVNENLDQRPLIALKAQGTPAPSLFLYGVVPLTLTRFLAYVLYRWEVCTRETVIVGLVGAGGLGLILTEQLSSFDYSRVVVTLGCFVLITFAVDWVSSAARRSLR